MSAQITIDNYSAANLLEQSPLTADAIVGATDLSLENNQGFATSDSVLVGAPGAEGSEVATVSAVNANQKDLTIGALKFKHLADAQVSKLFGTQAKIYRAPNNSTNLAPDDSQYTLLATVTLEADQATTTYTDNAGGDQYWYKYTLFNSTSSTETDRTQSPATRGDGSSSGNYTTPAAIRSEAGFNRAKYVTDEMIELKRAAAQDEINSALGGYYQVPFKAPINSFVADITTRLAAGLLMVEQFGAYDNSLKALGEKKRDDARADYAKLMAGSMTLKDANGSSLAVTDSESGGQLGGFNAWPNESTITNGQQYDASNGQPIAGSGDFMFRVDDRY